MSEEGLRETYSSWPETDEKLVARLGYVQSRAAQLEESTDSLDMASPPVYVQAGYSEYLVLHIRNGQAPTK